MIHAAGPSAQAGSINVAALPAGVYTVLLEGSEARAHARMVKE
jgi:hypothetical protein